MTPEAYCVDRARKAQDDHYYRFLFANHGQWLGTLAVRSIENQFDELIEQSSEPEVALTQLAWWRDELRRLQDGKPRHPTTRALLGSAMADAVNDADMEIWLAAIREEIENPVAADDAIWNTRLASRHSIADHWIMQGLGGQSDTPALAHYTKARSMARRYLGLGELVRHGFLGLPQRELEQVGITPDVIWQRAKTDELARYLNGLLTGVRESLVSAGHCLITKHTAGTPRMLIACVSIWHARVALIEDPCEVLDQRVALNPLRQIWITGNARPYLRRLA